MGYSETVLFDTEEEKEAFSVLKDSLKSQAMATLVVEPTVEKIIDLEKGELE